jgi:serralysin
MAIRYAIGGLAIGSAGDDILVSLGGPNTLIGGTGNDVYYVTNSGDQVQEESGAGYDTVVASVDFTIPTNVEVLYEFGSGLTGRGSSGNDILVSQGGLNTLVGLGGDDTLVSLGGPNTLIGGGGNDVYYVNNSGDYVQEALGGGSDTVVASVDFTIPTNVEVLYEIGSGLTGIGSSGDDTLVSLGGSNTLDGSDGNDTLVSLIGPNTLIGGGGNDVYYVNNSGDQVQEASGGGFDTVVASVDFTIPNNVEVLYEIGSGLTGTGSSGNDTLVSLGGSNTLIGGGGDDTLVSLGGWNTLTGSGGHDTFGFVWGQSNDTTIEDFSGNGPGAGDTLLFIGYGDGATLNQLNDEQWSINSANGLTLDIITFTNQASVQDSDYLFV